MSIFSWFALPKTQDDPTTIDEEIDSKIQDHKDDPDAHLEAGQMMQSHKASEIIDHLARSIVTDKLAEGAVTPIEQHVAAKIADCVVALEGGDFVSIEEAVAAGKKKIYVKAGAYQPAGILSLPKGTEIFGENKYSTILDMGYHGINFEIYGDGHYNKDWQVIASSTDGINLLGVDNGGRLWISHDSGATWVLTGPTPNSNRSWQSCASDADGSFLIACQYGGRVYTSSDSGVTWVETQPAGATTKAWYSVACDADGSNIIIAVYGGRLYTSANFGGSWAETQPAGNVDKNWGCVATDNDGSFLLAGVYGGRLYTSSNSGGAWTERQPGGAVNLNWHALACNDDGSFAVAGNVGGRLYTSVNSGVAWTERQPAGAVNANWWRAACDSDGSNIIVAGNGTGLYTSVNSGVAWTERKPNGLAGDSWASCASNSTGSILIAGITEGRAYISTDSGVTWTEMLPLTEDASASGISIHGFTIKGALDYGVYLKNCDDIDIFDNIFEDCGAPIYALTSLLDFANNIFIHDNDFIRCYALYIHNGNDTIFGTTEINANRFIDCQPNVADLNSWTKDYTLIFHDNSITFPLKQTSGYAVQLFGGIISKNYIYHAYTAIYMRDAIAEFNCIEYSNKHGIYFDAGANKIIGNLLAQIGIGNAGSCILNQYCAYTVITQNELNHSGAVCIDFVSASKNNISNNVIINTGNGVNLPSGCNSNVVIANIFNVSGTAIVDGGTSNDKVYNK